MKDTRPMEAQISELTEEQKTSILKTGKALLLYQTVVLIIFIAVAAIVFFTSERLSNAHEAVTKEYNQQKIVCDEAQEKLDQFTDKYRKQEQEISDLNTKLQLNKKDEAQYRQTLQQWEEKTEQQIEFLNQGIPLKENKEQNDTKLREISARQNIAYQEFMEFPFRTYWTILAICGFFFILLGPVFVKIKFPYYSEKKYRYLKKVK